MQVLFLCCYFSTASEKRQTAALYIVMEGEIVVLKLFHKFALQHYQGEKWALREYGVQTWNETY